MVFRLQCAGDPPPAVTTNRSAEGRPFVVGQVVWRGGGVVEGVQTEDHWPSAGAQLLPL